MYCVLRVFCVASTPKPNPLHLIAYLSSPPHHHFLTTPPPAKMSTSPPTDSSNILPQQALTKNLVAKITKDLNVRKLPYEKRLNDLIMESYADSSIEFSAKLEALQQEFPRLRQSTNFQDFMFKRKVFFQNAEQLRTKKAGWIEGKDDAEISDDFITQQVFDSVKEWPALLDQDPFFFKPSFLDLLVFTLFRSTSTAYTELGDEQLRAYCETIAKAHGYLFTTPMGVDDSSSETSKDAAPQLQEESIKEMQNILRQVARKLDTMTFHMDGFKQLNFDNEEHRFEELFNWFHLVGIDRDEKNPENVKDMFVKWFPLNKLRPFITTQDYTEFLFTLGKHSTQGLTVSEAKKVSALLQDANDRFSNVHNKLQNIESAKEKFLKSQPKKCQTCGTIPETVLRCSQCKVATYCSRECALKDWKSGHKKVCKTLAQENQSEEKR